MNKSKILIIDDELNIRETVNEVLSLNDYQTKTAKNGQDALNILDNWTPDLIICDIIMPIMDGHDFQKIVHNDKLLSTIPFIFITAKTEDDLMRNCFHDGADDFLTKPFKINDLLKTVSVKIERFKKIKKANDLSIGKERFFSHEINTPLHGILGSINILMNDSYNLKKHDVNDFYAAIKVSGERLNRTMHNIALFEKIKGNTMEFSSTEFSEIKTNFETVLLQFSKQLKKQENRLVFNFITAELQISNKNLSFILFELLDNALKFSPVNKKVVIEGRMFKDEFYEINIFDSGVGFKEDELKMIDAAVQFNRDEKEQQGLGLGLYISKFIIKKSNGIISLVSKEDEGTKISILLPIHKKERITS
jgi:two-component system sensor kinase